MFSPDREHLHHRLLARGLSPRKTVLILYGVCACLALAALTFGFADWKTDLVVIVVLFLGSLWGARRLGLFDVQLRSLPLTRRRNRELGAVVTAITRRLRQATEPAEVIESIRELAPVVAASEITARLGSIIWVCYSQKATGGQLAHRRFVVRDRGRRVGDLEIAWDPGRSLPDMDCAMAIEQICDELGGALRRLALGRAASQPSLSSVQAPGPRARRAGRA